MFYAFLMALHYAPCGVEQQWFNEKDMKVVQAQLKLLDEMFCFGLKGVLLFIIQEERKKKSEATTVCNNNKKRTIVNQQSEHLQQKITTIDGITSPSCRGSQTTTY